MSQAAKSAEDVRALAVALEQLLALLSEECYRAGWMVDTEFDAWRLMTEGGSWGGGSADSERHLLDAIRAVAEAAGCWVARDYDTRDWHPVPLDEWRERYAAWRVDYLRHFPNPNHWA